MPADRGRTERSNISAKVERPNELDNAFGPDVDITEAPGLDKRNLPPTAGTQFFGQIDGASGQMTVTPARPRRHMVDHARSQARVDF